MSDRLSYGDRVRVLDSYHWAEGERGTVTVPPHVVKELAGDWHDLHRMVEQQGGVPMTYWVAFDNARFDADGDGPYEGAEIPREYLAHLRPRWLHWLWPALAVVAVPAAFVAFLVDLIADVIWGNADLNVVVFVVTFLVAAAIMIEFRPARIGAEWFLVWFNRLWSLWPAAVAAFLVALVSDLLWFNAYVNILVFGAAFLVAAFVIQKIRARRPPD